MTSPFVSIVMPVRNEAAFIHRSLGAVLAQDYAGGLEVIVADGMSTDGTRAVLQGLQSGDARIILVDNPRAIVATGLNLALSRARGDVVVRVDGHCEIAPDYVRLAVAHLHSSGAGGVGGPLETVGETLWAQVIACAMSSRFGVGNSTFRVSKAQAELVDTVAFPAYTRAVIDRAGPYDEELVRNQDDEYNYRLRKLGVTLLLAANMRARYYSRSSLRSLWRQYFQYGYWKVRVMQKHPRQMRPRQFVPVTFVAGLAACVLLAPAFVAARWGMALVVTAYVGANLAASWEVSRKMPNRPLLRLAATFGVLHVAYGCGFITGLVKFASRWPTVRSSPAVPARRHPEAESSGGRSNA